MDEMTIEIWVKLRWKYRRNDDRNIEEMTLKIFTYILNEDRNIDEIQQKYR